MPLPSDPRTVFLGGLFILALLTALSVARAIVLPFVLKLCSSRSFGCSRASARPEIVGAILAIVLLFVVLGQLGDRPFRAGVLLGGEAASRLTAPAGPPELTAAAD